jgi:hypothetical protein
MDSRTWSGHLPVGVDSSKVDLLKLWDGTIDQIA